MSLTRRFGRTALLAGFTTALGLLAACANVPGETVCPERGQNSASWPYCAPSDPGGGGGIMRDDRINPSGGRN
ncbi:MAG TPA: hypothetical protein DF715_13565 [Oceanicaulis sp.]|jgi:hypothetical protein|uniref:Lipoprotein n=1 Tax=Glycocaulis albus TaxID=1382801 RepID=A0ABQ1XEJ2_9PROT|nr:hypothetical protein [Glycocaulis albus]MBV5256869.1 hypothetical protein [Synechococcus moorigangaii CMS01]GGG89555.1 hypothetical protein GCM10007420_00720 [Glycocaulis albus]HCY56490.1 hypothetical protein [Oceanicaulis sp.]